MSGEINYGAVATEWNRGGARRALAELKRQGFVIVPVVPTVEIIEAGWDGDSFVTIEEIYRAMVTVAEVTA